MDEWHFADEWTFARVRRIVLTVAGIVLLGYFVATAPDMTRKHRPWYFGPGTEADQKFLSGLPTPTGGCTGKVPNRHIVYLRIGSYDPGTVEGTTPGERSHRVVNDLAETYGLTVIDRRPLTNAPDTVASFRAIIPSGRVDAVRNDSHVEYVELHECD